MCLFVVRIYLLTHCVRIIYLLVNRYTLYMRFYIHLLEICVCGLATEQPGPPSSTSRVLGQWAYTNTLAKYAVSSVELEKQN